MAKLDDMIIELCESMHSMQQRYRAGEVLDDVPDDVIQAIDSIDFNHMSIAFLRSENNEICFSIE